MPVSEKVIRQGLLTQGEEGEDRWSAALGSPVFFTNYPMPILRPADPAKGYRRVGSFREDVVWRWYPSIKTAVDELPNPTDDEPLANGMKRGAWAVAEERRRREILESRGITYVVRFLGGTRTVEEMVSAAKASLERAKAEPTTVDTAAERYNTEYGKYGTAVDVDSQESALANDQSGIAAVRKQL